MLLHPSATNTSGVVQAVATAVDSMVERLRQEAESEEREREAAPRRQLAATGLQMSLVQNRSAALSVEPEMDPVLSWFTADSSIVTGVYGPPQWSSIAAIRAACAKLPTATQKPAQFVAGLCYPCCAGCAADWDDFRALLNRWRARPGGSELR